MKFHAPSFFAGVGTVFAAIVLGFGGGFMISSPAQNSEPNRIERLAANAPLPSPPTVQAQVASKPEPAALVPTEKPVTKQQETEAVPVLAKDDTAARDEARDTQRKRASEKKKAERKKWVERKQRQQELEAATRVQQMDRNANREVMVQREEPRFGFFGND